MKRAALTMKKHPVSVIRQREIKMCMNFLDIPEIERNAHRYDNGVLYHGDCLKVMKSLPDEFIDLIYIDPPFCCRTDKQFGNKFKPGEYLQQEYIPWMNARLFEMKRLLKSTGSIFVHLDWHAAHYIKVEMDKMFGCGGDKNEPGFRNEIIWFYKTGGATKDRWSRKHDSILMYTKTSNWTFNTQKERSYMMHKYGFKKSDFKIDPENGLQYTMVYSRDVWDMPSVGSATAERIGYPTQKPELLLERIILASSNPGDVVADFFCGGGTTISVAQKLNRRWIGCDNNPKAIEITEKRIKDLV